MNYLLEEIFNEGYFNNEEVVHQKPVILFLNHIFKFSSRRKRSIWAEIED